MKPALGYLGLSLKPELLTGSSSPEGLLKAFSPDAEEGPKLLLLMQKKLTRSFEGRGCYSPDDSIDEVINRVARRLEEGEIIYNLNGYFLEVGHRVHHEWLRRRTNKFLDDIPEPPLPSPQPPDDEEKETRMSCLDHCLEELTAQNRQLILNYYQDERRVKINHRKQMAETMGIPLNLSQANNSSLEFPRVLATALSKLAVEVFLRNHESVPI